MKKSLVVVLSVSLLVLAVSRISYSYFKNYGISKEEHLSVVAKKLAVIFTDNSELTGEIYPDYYESKTFSVENKSESLYKYDIIFENLVNTFETEGFLQYKITSTDGGYSMKEFEDIPKTDVEQDTILAYSIEIEDGKKHNYKLEIRYQNSETDDQSADMGKVLSGNLAIKEGTKNPKLKQVTLNVENGTPETCTIEVLENNDATFEVAPNEGYTTKGAKLTCDNEYSTTINEETTSITIPNITSGTSCTLTMKKDTKGLFYDVIIADNQEKGISTRTTFNMAFTGTAGLYVENDTKFIETGTGQTKNAVYYYAGNTTNNWVKFGQENGQDIWWRIIRTNEDGSIRLLYAGKGENGHTSTDGYINKSKYNEEYLNTMYVGYMYGTIGDLASNRTNDNSSTIKTAIDNWYKSNLEKEYEKFLSKTAIYCNDRATDSYSTKSMSYVGVSRLNSNKRPSFKCGVNYKGIELAERNIADRFTISTNNSTGNGQLNYPIALMTADEVAYAGSIYDNSGSGSTTNTYYSKNSTGVSVTGSQFWFTMSPYSSYSAAGEVLMFYVAENGVLRSTDTKSTGGVRPVLSLKSCVEVTGKGTTDDPYIPSIDDACALADN